MHTVSGNDVLVNLSIMHLFCFPTLAARLYLKKYFYRVHMDQMNPMKRAVV